MHENLLTIKQFAEKNKKLDRWPFTETSIRSIYWNRKTNRIEHAFVKVAGKVLVDEKKFYTHSQSRIDNL